VKSCFSVTADVHTDATEGQKAELAWAVIDAICRGCDGVPIYVLAAAAAVPHSVTAEV